MTHIRIAWNRQTSQGDWQRGPLGLADGPALEAAIYVSLFTDRRARDDDAKAGADKRGWWGDSFATRQIGSRLWLLRREKRTEDTRRRAEEMCVEAMAWLLDDEVAAKVACTAEWQGSMLALLIQVFERDGAVQPFRYLWAWDELRG